MTEPKERTEVVSVRLPTSLDSLFKRLAAAEGRTASEHLEYLVNEALIAAGLMPPDKVRLHNLREGLMRRFLDKAVAIYTATPRADITAETARQVMQDAGWAADYAEYTKAKDRNTINPTLGRRVKLRLNLRTGPVYAVPQPSIFGASSFLLPAPAAEEEGTPEAA